jgi:hypothetical protein
MISLLRCSAVSMSKTCIRTSSSTSTSSPSSPTWASSTRLPFLCASSGFASTFRKSVRNSGGVIIDLELNIKLTGIQAPKLLTRRQPAQEAEKGKDAENDRLSLDNKSLPGLDVNVASNTDMVASSNKNGVMSEQPVLNQRITFDPAAHDPRSDSTLYIPSPREREQG